jgi:hypothetical protein
MTNIEYFLSYAETVFFKDMESRRGPIWEE